MLWSKNVPCDYQYVHDELIVFETKYWLKKLGFTTVLYICWYTFILVFISKGKADIRDWPVFLFLAIAIAAPFYRVYLAYIRHQKGRQLYSFDKKTSTILLNGNQVCTFNDVTSLQFQVNIDRNSKNDGTTFTYCVLINYGNEQISFDCLDKGLVAVIIIDEIAAVTGVKYYFDDIRNDYVSDLEDDQLRLQQYKKCLAEKKEFDGFLAKYADCDEAKIKEVISYEKFSDTIAYKAAATTLRRRTLKPQLS